MARAENRDRYLPWREAMAEALYGPGGFYRANRPVHHFRTSPHTGPLFASALWALVARVDAMLGSPKRLDVVDMGAGGGELLLALWALACGDEDLRQRIRFIGVDIAPRPAELPEAISWCPQLPRITGLLLANEWLDNVPVDVAEHDGGKPRLVTVDPSGKERTDRELSELDRTWLDRWWPTKEPGDRAEVGRLRDTAWAAAVEKVNAGLAVAIDYGHLRDSRPDQGSLTGYRRGFQCPPTPDGSCDITAHVAVDSAAEAGHSATPRCEKPVLTTQREALAALGIQTGRPPRELASTNPAAYLRALSQASHAAELVDPAGLGGFFWLAQPVGIAGTFLEVGGFAQPSAAVNFQEVDRQ